MWLCVQALRSAATGAFKALRGVSYGRADFRVGHDGGCVRDVCMMCVVCVVCVWAVGCGLCVSHFVL